MRNFTKFYKNEDGSVLILVALAMVVLLGFTALVIDVGRMYITKSELQKAVDAAALAGAQELPIKNDAENVAYDIGQENGLQISELDVNTPYNGYGRKIEVIATRKVHFTFARVLGFTEIDVSARAVATKDYGAFGYTIFHGNESKALTLGSKLEVQGDVHSNNKVILTGNNHIITGVLEAVTEIEINGNVSSNDIGSLVPGANYIPMPDLTEYINEIKSDPATNIIEDDLIIKKNDPTYVINGNYYVIGDIEIYGSSFAGSGALYSTGSITFNGSRVNMTSNNQISLYSQSGDITFNGGGAITYAALYAPNGTITLNGANSTVYGRVIGDEVVPNGSGFKVIDHEFGLDGFPSVIKLIE